MLACKAAPRRPMRLARRRGNQDRGGRAEMHAAGRTKPLRRASEPGDRAADGGRRASPRPGSPPWAARPLPSRRSRRRRPPAPNPTERRQEAPAGAARRQAAQDRVAPRGRPRLSNRPPIRSRSRRSRPAAAEYSLRPGRSRPAGRRAGPIRPTSRHKARSRARRADTAPASAPARRRRSRRWSRSVLSGRRRRR